MASLLWMLGSHVQSGPQEMLHSFLHVGNPKELSLQAGLPTDKNGSNFLVI
jgi:hypothetical protein